MKNDVQVLIIEDDRYISDFVRLSLDQEGYGVLTAASAAEGLFLFSGNRPDIVLLDLGLPDCDGLEVIREIRSFSEAPILVVSARGLEREKIEALDLGADDYITKPFHMGELLARIRVARRKMSLSSQAGADGTFVLNGLAVDSEKRLVSVDGADVHLTPLEFRTLQLMIKHRGKVLTHNQIARDVWGYAGQEDTRTIRVVIASLRRKIEKNSAEPRYIITEIGVGYRFADE